MFLSKAFTFNTYTAFQTHDSLLRAAPVEESKQRGKQAFVWIYNHCLNVSTKLIFCAVLVPRDIKLQLRCLTQLTKKLLRPAWPSPTHCLWSKGRRQVILLLNGSIRSICAEQLMSVTQGWMYLFSNLYTCKRQRNQFKSFFQLQTVYRFWELELCIWVGYKVRILCDTDISCTIKSCYWSLLVFFFSLIQNFRLWRSMIHQFVRETHLSIKAAHFHMHEFFFISEQRQFNTIQPDKLTYCIWVLPSNNAVWAALKPKKLSVYSKKFSIKKCP